MGHKRLLEIPRLSSNVETTLITILRGQKWTDEVETLEMTTISHFLTQIGSKFGPNYFLMVYLKFTLTWNCHPGIINN